MNKNLTKQEIGERGLHFLLGSDEKFSFQRQLFNASALLSILICILSVTACVVSGLQMILLLLSIVSAGIFFVLYGIGRWSGYDARVVWAYLFFHYIIILFYWMVMGGYMGIFLPIILVLTCILPILLSGWQLFLAFLINCSVLIAVYLAEILFPQYIINQDPTIQCLSERFFSVVLLGALISLLVLLVGRNYHRQQDIIRKLTLKDGLTGLYNRRFFNQIFQREINRARRDNKHLCLLMIDLDDFKKYNDTHGHQKGDEALKSIGKLLKSLISRGSDYAFRLGGNEFALIFSGQDPGEAGIFAEKVRYKIESLRIEHIDSNAGLFMTASLGLASIIPSEDMNMDWFYYNADQGLQKAKQSGKNRIEIE